MFHLFGQTRMTALLVAIFVLFAGGLAQAQQKPSSVRPPVGAIQTEPGGSLPGRALGNISDSETWRKIRMTPPAGSRPPIQMIPFWCGPRERISGI
jgi:hypothetical protein